jgi:hypothetical protein
LKFEPSKFGMIIKKDEVNGEKWRRKKKRIDSKRVVI